MSPEELLNKAVDRAALCLGRRDFGTRELTDRLTTRYGFPREAAEAATARLVELGYVDDARCAEETARQLFARGKSRLQVAQALSARLFDRDVIDAALEAVAPDPRDQIRRLIEQAGGMRALATPDARAKQIRACLRRGFSAGDVRAVIRETEHADGSVDDPIPAYYDSMNETEDSD